MTYIFWYSDSALYIQYSVLFDEQASFFGYWFSVIWAIHDLAILNHFPISSYSGLLKFDMKILVRNMPVVYSRHEAGVSVYFGHIVFN